MEKNASIYREKKVTNGKIKISLVVNCQSPGFFLTCIAEFSIKMNT